MRYLLYLLLLWINLSSATTIDINMGAKLAQQQCEICHRTADNTALAAWPKLAGQYQNYLLKQLHDYQMGQNGPRYNPLMLQIVRQLNDYELLNITAYYAGQNRSNGYSVAHLLARGQQLYRSGDLAKGITACSACHAPDGGGNNNANFPVLAGQRSQYLVIQLQAFRSGIRHNDPKAIMRSIAERMSDTDILAVANYIAGLHE